MLRKLNILFLTAGGAIDYENDCIFHGLCQLDEVNVFILNEHNFDYMFEEGYYSDDLKKCYGKGFTITNKIPVSKKKVHSKAEALNNIVSHFYDLIIFGSIYRCSIFFNEVCQHYKKNEIFIIDGDDDDFHQGYGRSFFACLRRNSKAFALAKKGTYFKRELLPRFSSVFHPVSFAIPEELVLSKIPPKTRVLAVLIPGDQKTYIYDTESDYYAGYQEAEFAVSHRKAGWDCLRHYEILANGCIPYFPGIEKLPETTMTFFPRKTLMKTNALYEKGISDAQYEFYCNTLLKYTRDFLTTTYLSEYVLSFL